MARKRSLGSTALFVSCHVLLLCAACVRTSGEDEQQTQPAEQQSQASDQQPQTADANNEQGDTKKVECLEHDYALEGETDQGCERLPADLPAEGKVVQLGDESANESAEGSSDTTPPSGAEGDRNVKEKENISWNCRPLYSVDNSRIVAEDSKVHVQFDGEFGYELLVVLPFAYYHFLQGTLRSTVSCGDASTSLYYYFSPNHTYNASCSRRDTYWESLHPYGWEQGLHNSEIPKEWFPPPYAPHFREYGKVWLDVPAFTPFVVISNKYEKEWNCCPTNFLDLDILKKVITKFVEAGYYVLYNRAGASLQADEWQKGSNSYPPFEDRKMIRTLYGGTEHVNKVMMTQDLLNAYPGMSFNEAQLRVMARSRCFISVQGGTSLLSSYWGGTNIIFVRRGHEIESKSFSRYYHKLAQSHIVAVRTYDRLEARVDDMIRRGVCGAY